MVYLANARAQDRSSLPKFTDTDHLVCLVLGSGLLLEPVTPLAGLIPLTGKAEVSEHVIVNPNLYLELKVCPGFQVNSLNIYKVVSPAF